VHVGKRLLLMHLSHKLLRVNQERLRSPNIRTRMRYQTYSMNHPILGANLSTWLINSTDTVLPAAACILIEARHAYCKEHNARFSLCFFLKKQRFELLFQAITSYQLNRKRKKNLKVTEAFMYQSFLNLFSSSIFIIFLQSADATSSTRCNPHATWRPCGPPSATKHLKSD
jgi:hypothetical protein